MAQLAVRGPHRDRVSLALEPARQTLLGSVERGVASGELRADIEPKTLARLIEGAAISVLDEATRTGMSGREGHRLVMLSGLSVAGLSWREANDIISTCSELQFVEEPLP